MRTGTGKAIQGLRHIFTNTTAKVVKIPIEAILDHNRGIITIITGVANNVQIPYKGVIAINLAITPHIDHTADHPCTEAHHTTPEIKACHIYAHPTNPHDEIHIGHPCTSVDH